MEHHLTATEGHLLYMGMGSQCYLPSDTSEHTRLNPSQTGSIYLPRRDGRL